MSICVIVPAAGSGSRLECTTPKAFVSVGGRTLLAHSLEAILSSGVATTIVVAAPEEFLLAAQDVIDALASRSGDGTREAEILVVAGGADRIGSVDAALHAAGENDIVLVHDAARALAPPDVFRRVVSAIGSGAEAVVPVLPMIDTVRRAEPVAPSTTGSGNSASAASIADSPVAPAQNSEDAWRIQAEAAADFELDPSHMVTAPEAEGPATGLEVLRGDLDRASLRRVQTPQGFTLAMLRRAHAAYREEVRTQGAGAREATDDAGLVERLGVDVLAVAGDEEALKITYPLDLVLAEHIVRQRSRAHACARDRAADQD